MATMLFYDERTKEDGSLLALTTADPIGISIAGENVTPRWVSGVGRTTRYKKGKPRKLRARPFDFTGKV